MLYTCIIHTMQVSCGMLTLRGTFLFYMEKIHNRGACCVCVATGTNNCVVQVNAVASSVDHLIIIMVF